LFNYDLYGGSTPETLNQGLIYFLPSSYVVEMANRYAIIELNDNYKNYWSIKNMDSLHISGVTTLSISSEQIII
jgi:hypothetical protein